MLSEEEKKAIEIFNDLINYLEKWNKNLTLIPEDKKYYKTVLNLITKLQKENEYWKNGFERELEANRENTCELLKQDLMIKEKDKQIQLMSEYMEENMDEHQLDEIYAKQYNCNGMERNWTRGKEKEVEDIKQFFEKLAKEKDI